MYFRSHPAAYGQNPLYVAPETATLRLTSHTGLLDSKMKVNDATGRLIFVCREGVGLHQKKTLSDEWDNTVFTTSTSAMGKNRKTEGLDGRGVRVFTAIKHKTSDRTGIEIDFVDPAHRPQVATIVGDPGNGSRATVQSGTRLLARLAWDDLGSGFTTSSSGHYSLTVEKGVDIALIVIWVAIYDMMRMETALKVLVDVLGAI